MKTTSASGGACGTADDTNANSRWTNEYTDTNADTDPYGSTGINQYANQNTDENTNTYANGNDNTGRSYSFIMPGCELCSDSRWRSRSV